MPVPTTGIYRVGDRVTYRREGYTVEAVTDTGHALEVTFALTDDERSESGEVAIARFSSGAAWEFVDRGRSLPITPIGSPV